MRLTIPIVLAVLTAVLINAGSSHVPSTKSLNADENYPLGEYTLILSRCPINRLFPYGPLTMELPGWITCSIPRLNP